jgi:GNAT superfamily N-acetyltransferase
VTPSQPEINIREATAEDVNSILLMAERFYVSTAYAKVSDWEATRAAETALQYINSDAHLLLLATVNDLPVGFIMAFRTIPMWSNTPMGIETIFWVEPEVRNLGLGRLLKASYLQWCILNGCELWCLGNALDIETTEELDKSLKKMNMLPAEAMYVGKI